MAGLTSPFDVPVGRVAGVPVALSPGVVAGAVGGGALALLWGSALDAVTIFAAVLLGLLVHELAHGAAARREGYDVDGVRVSLVGGTVAWSGPPPDAHTAVLIAAAGPAASALLAVGGVLASVVVDGWWLQTWVSVNLLAATVNLLPLPGLDGHAIVRALRSPDRS